MTDITPIDDFIPLVTRHAPGFNDLAVEAALRNAARLLCEATKVWRETATFALVEPAGQLLETIGDAEIEFIEVAFLDGVKLEPKTIGWLDQHNPMWRVDEDVTGTARYVTQLTDDEIAVYPLATGTMKAAFILKPSAEAENLPTLLKKKYSDELGRGAAAILLTSPSSQNPQLGLDHRAWFDARIAELKVKILRGQQRGRLRASPHWF